MNTETELRSVSRIYNIPGICVIKFLFLNMRNIV